MDCFQVRSRERFPIGQNVRKRDSTVRAALGLLQKADCDRLGDRIARGCLACVRLAGEHWEGSDTSAVIFNRLEDGLQDSLFGATEHAEVRDSRQGDANRPAHREIIDLVLSVPDEPI